jgi:hypothetical protein
VQLYGPQCTSMCTPSGSQGKERNLQVNQDKRILPQIVAECTCRFCRMSRVSVPSLLLGAGRVLGVGPRESQDLSHDPRSQVRGQGRQELLYVLG